MNPLAKAVREYLALRRGLGFKLVRHEGMHLRVAPARAVLEKEG
jgi:hypothetical protein